MNSKFKQSLVTVGKATYGYLNIINYSNERMLKIGSFCSIGPDVLFIVCGEHDSNLLSTYPYKVRFMHDEHEAISRGDIIIEDDVWIGARSIILSGVTIGQGAVIGAGSIVTKNIPPYTVAAGVPARVLKNRCSSERAKELLNVDFDNLNATDIHSHIQDLYSPIENADISWLPKRR